MKVSEIGEFRLIELLTKIVEENRGKLADNRQQLVIGIGDDTAAWLCDDSVNLATTDCLVQDVHFRLDMTTWKELGWKSLAISLSDIAAMGGVPIYVLVSLGLPGDTDVDNVSELYHGITELGNRFGVSVIGGNISSSATAFITTTVFGSATDRDRILTRSAAKPGELIAITGRLGAAAAGLEMLKQKMKPDAETDNSLRQAFLHPYPHIAEGQLLAENGVKAAMDISDGLIADLGHLCKSSLVGAKVFVDSIPIHPAVSEAFGDKALEMALSGGEDYELLFTATSDIIEEIKAKASVPITVIGEIIPDEAGIINIIDSGNKPYKTTVTGWQHFAERG